MLEVRQQARFRVFEEQMERRKLQLLLRAPGRADDWFRDPWIDRLPDASSGSKRAYQLWYTEDPPFFR